MHTACIVVLLLSHSRLGPLRPPSHTHTPPCPPQKETMTDHPRPPPRRILPPEIGSLPRGRISPCSGEPSWRREKYDNRAVGFASVVCLLVCFFSRAWIGWEERESSMDRGTPGEPLPASSPSLPGGGRERERERGRRNRTRLRESALDPCASDSSSPSPFPPAGVSWDAGGGGACALRRRYVEDG